MTPRLHSLHCVSFGVFFELSADSDRLLALMIEDAPLGTRTCMPSPGVPSPLKLQLTQESAGYRLNVDEQTVARNSSLQPVREHFARDLMVHIANQAPDRVFMHAGVVGCQGHALVLPGVSFAGKTTLVAELVRAGAIYYSDEYAVIDDYGHVHPYARDLQMRQPGQPAQIPLHVQPLGGTVGTSPLHVSHIVFAEYHERGNWLPTPVSRGMAVLEMLRHTIPVQRTPARVMSTLAMMMATASASRSERGEASDTAQALLIAMEMASHSTSV